MTLGFSRLTVSGYRRLKAVEITLRPLNVLIGANGVGKSSILDIFRLLAASADGRLAATIADAGSFPILVTADGLTNSITLGVQLNQDNVIPNYYELSLTLAGFSYIIARENLTVLQGIVASAPQMFIASDGARVRYFLGGNYVEPDWEYKWSETSLSQTPKTGRDAEGFRHALGDVSEVYHVLDVANRAPIRTPQILTPATTPGINGEHLVSCLFTISQTARDRFEAIEDALRAAFPTFEGLDFPPVAAGRVTLAWRERGFTRPFYANELSEGTLRFLWLATLLQSPGLPKVTLIDEPEVSLHPEMLRLLADLMREASDRTQLIVATHSDRFVRFLEPDELLVCDRDNDGGMTVQRADELDLKAWMEDYTLDQLWSMGRLGGRA
jgi:predicted ATPase